MTNEKEDPNHCLLLPFPGDELDKITRGLLEIKERRGNIELDPKLVLEHIDCLYSFIATFKDGTSNAENFLTLADIEVLFLTFKSRLSDLAFKILLDSMSSLKGESDLIIKKKEEYRQLGVRLKNFHLYTSSIVTLAGRVSFKRMALRPSTRLDAEKLLATTGRRGFVYPVDLALEISKLPFNLTMAATLLVAKVAVQTSSYEEAEDRLRQEASIKVNDDTIRKITNSLGTIVYQNDLLEANTIWARLSSSKLISLKEKRPHVLYLLTAGTRFSIQEKDEKGSIWRENIKGTAFSSDNMTFWVDKHGKSHPRIDKLEFMNYIGHNEDFKRFLFSLAIRHGYGSYKEVVLLSDGASWIRDTRDELFPEAQLILDINYLCEKINNFAKNIISIDEILFNAWSQKVRDLLMSSKIDEVLNMISDIKTNKFNNIFLNIYQYIKDNIDSLDYANYIKKGYFIGSLEIQNPKSYGLPKRLKRPGTRWKAANGQAMASLRAKFESGLWERDVVKASYRYYGIRPPAILS
ncbi:MAG: hypothetical protein LBI10_02115 [Deltaproteobacteria bacterium]|nr:hypothetical protein [Deltaproteobacteria bacterium]